MASTVPSIEVRLLGPLEVRRDGQPIELPGRRERSVLALLGSRVAEPVSVAHLQSFLWADAPPRTADKTLQTYVSRLRGLLTDDRASGAQLLRRLGAGYALVLPRDAVDAASFADLVTAARAAEHADALDDAVRTYDRALALWRGTSPTDAPDTPDATAWHQRLAAARLDAVEARLQLLVRMGRYSDAAAELDELVVAEPYREELWALLMEALARAGRRPAALAAYQQARDRLVDELGLDPSLQLQELQRRIIAHGLQPAPPGRDAVDTSTTPWSRRQRLPAPLTPLIGRHEDRRRLLEALAGSRLVTLTGTGGVGKTRLAIAAAAAVGDAALCELAPLREPDAVSYALATAVGVEPVPGEDPVAAVAAALADHALLLVVDNCEHLLAEARRCVYAVLSQCPQVTVLATSRQPLGVGEEVVVRLAPLPLEDDGASAQLFIDRAHRAGMQIAGGARERAAVGAICRQLDGLPLAIELAAAMAPALTLGDLLRHLEDPFRLLAEHRVLGGRERSLRDTVEWSYRLLDPQAQAVFRRASIFASGLTAAAARAVCADVDVSTDEVAVLLPRLAERSLLQRVDGDGRTRYRMLETLREFGRGALAPNESRILGQRHARWAVDLTEQLAARQLGADEAAAVAAFDRGLDDVRVAFRWALDHDDADAALRIVVATHWFAFLGLRTELSTWSFASVERFRDAGHPLLTEALGATAAWRGLTGDAEGSADDAKAIRAIADRTGTIGSLALSSCAAVAAREDDLEAAQQDLDRLRAIDPTGYIAIVTEGDLLVFHAAADPGGAAPRIAALLAAAPTFPAPSVRAFAAVGAATLRHHDDATALAMLRDAIVIARSVGSRFIERAALSYMAPIAARTDDPDDAFTAFGEALGAWQRDGVWRMEWGSLQNFMDLLARLGRHRELLTLHAASTASATAPPLIGGQAVRITDAVARAEAALGSKACAAATAAGAAMSDAQAVTYARSIADVERV